MKVLVILIALGVTCLCKSLEKTKLKDPKTTGSANDHYGSKLFVYKKQPLSPTTTPKPEVDEDENNALYYMFDPPQLFSGGEKDIPQTVLDAKPGTIVTYKGIQHIWRSKQTRQDCFKACIYERRILCEYYFQLTDAEKCILMVQDYRKLPVSKPPSVIQRPSTKLIRTKKSKITQKRIYNIVPNVIPNKKDETDSELTPIQMTETEPEIILTKLNFKEPEQMSNKMEVTVSKTIPKTNKLDALVPETMPPKLDALVSETKPQKLDILVSETSEIPTKPEAKIVIEVPKVPKINKEFIVNKEDLSTLKQMIENIENRFTESLKYFHTGADTHDRFMHSLLLKQNNLKKTLYHLQNQMRLIKSINPQFVKTVNQMDNRHETLVGQVDTMGKYEHQIANSLASMDAKVVRIDGALENIKESNEKVSRQLSGEELANPEFNRNILALRRQVENLKDKVKKSPTLMMLTKNQRVLSEALQSLDRQLAEYGRRVSHLDASANEWSGRLYHQEENHKTLSDAVSTLSGAVRELRNDVLRIENPQSEVNLKKFKILRQLRSDMDIMEKSYSKLQTEISSTRMDLTRLVKDLVNLQVSYHDSKTSIIGLVEANKNIKLDTHHMKTDQDQMLTQIETLATVYRSVLSAIHDLELKQIHVMQQLERDKHDMIRLSNGSEKNSKYKYMYQNTQNQLLLTIKKFQTKLLLKFYDLKSDVEKVKKDLHLKQETKEQGKKDHPAET